MEEPAQIYVMIGAYELAIEQLEYLLSMPSKFSRQMIRINPVWKPLHNHPRFIELLEKNNPKQ